MDDKSSVGTVQTQSPDDKSSVGTVQIQSPNDRSSVGSFTAVGDADAVEEQNKCPAEVT